MKPEQSLSDLRDTALRLRKDFQAAHQANVSLLDKINRRLFVMELAAMVIVIPVVLACVVTVGMFVMGATAFAGLAAAG